MRGKRAVSIVLAAVLLLGLTACGAKEGAVYVQSVEDLANLGGIAPGDRFAGVVVSENVAEITKDNDKSVAELMSGRATMSPRARSCLPMTPRSCS